MPGIRIAAVAASESETGRANSVILSFAQTDSAGRFRLEGIPPGRYYILAGSLESPSYYPGVHTLSAATDVTVADRTVANTQDFRFVPPGGIVHVERAPEEVSSRFFGVVNDGWGRPIPMVTVILTHSQAGTRYVTCTDRSGAFDFTGLPAGDFAFESLPAVRTGYYGRQRVMLMPDLGGYERVTGTISIRPREALRAGIRIRQLAPLDSAWQDRPDVYARPVRLSTAGGISGGGPLRGVQEPTLPYPQGFKGAQSGDVVAIQLLIGTDGDLMWLQVVSPDADPELARAALQQVVKMTFRPVVLADGRSLATLGTINVHFAGQ